MKAKILSLILLAIGWQSIESKAQQLGLGKHYINLGPQVSYDLSQKKALFGVGTGYEFRLNKNWGLTASANFNTGMDEGGMAIFSESGGQNLLNIANHNISVGTRFYINRFYFGAGFGYGEERSKLQYSDNRGTRWESEGGFYQAYTVGYQIPVKKHKLEIFASAGGTKNLNVTTGIRLNFNLEK